MTNTMTKRDFYNAFIDMLNGKEVDVTPEAMIDFCNHEIELLDKKAASAKKAPKKADALMDTVYGALTTEPQTIDDIAAALGVSNAKVTYRLTSLVKAGKAVQGSVKIDKSKKATYALVG